MRIDQIFDPADYPIDNATFQAECKAKFDADADAGEMGFEAVADILDGITAVRKLTVAAGILTFFRGRNALHRVAPNFGARDRILAVPAHNAEPGVALSETARTTFYGRTG